MASLQSEIEKYKKVGIILGWTIFRPQVINVFKYLFKKCQVRDIADLT